MCYAIICFYIYFCIVNSEKQFYFVNQFFKYSIFILFIFGIFSHLSGKEIDYSNESKPNISIYDHSTLSSEHSKDMDVWIKAIEIKVENTNFSDLQDLGSKILLFLCVSFTFCMIIFSQKIRSYKTSRSRLHSHKSRAKYLLYHSFTFYF